MPWMQFLKDYEKHKTGNVVDVGRFSHCCALVQAGIAIWATEPGDIDASGADDYNDVLFSQDTNGDVTGPTAAEVSGNYVLLADNTWGDPATLPGHTGTTGSIFFAGAGGAGSSPTEDNPNLFWDDTNDYLGVGTNSGLNARLHIAGDVDEDNLSEIRRTNGTAGAHSIFIGESVATVPDFAVWGDGRVSVNTGQATTNAQLRVEMVNDGPSLAYAFAVDNNRDGGLDTEVCALFNHLGLVGDCIDVQANSITTAIGIDVSVNGLTTGTGILVSSSSTSVAQRELLSLTNTASAATGCRPLYVEQHAAAKMAEFRSGASDIIFDWNTTGHMRVRPLQSNTDIAPSDDATLKKWSIQRLGSDPTNAAFIKFSNSPGTPTNDFYLVLEEE